MAKLSDYVRKGVPVRLPDGSALFYVGIAADAEFSGAMFNHTTLKNLRLKDGDWCEFTSEDHSTAIIRQIVCGSCAGYANLRNDRAYLDPQSAHYLGCLVHEVVRVRLAKFSFDVP